MQSTASEKRISLKNILYATDFSPASSMALPYVRGIARRYGSKVYVLHVRQASPYVFATPETVPLAAEVEEQQAQADAEEFHKIFAKFSHEVLIEKGDLWDAVAEVVEEKAIDLIVIGTRGRTGVGKFLLGSVATEILRRAACPVLTVGPHVSGSVTERLEMSEILYATDFSPESIAAAPYAISLAQEHQAQLVLLNVIKEPEAGELVHANHYIESTIRLLRELIPSGAEAWCKPQCIVTSGNTVARILEIANERGSDLIVLGVRNTGGLMSVATHLSRAVAQEVVAKAPCPVLTVRRAKLDH